MSSSQAASKSGKHLRSESEDGTGSAGKRRPDVPQGFPGFSGFGNTAASDASLKNSDEPSFLLGRDSVNRTTNNPWSSSPHPGQNTVKEPFSFTSILEKCKTQPTKHAYTVELSTDDFPISSTEPSKRILPADELIALLLDSEKSGTCSLSEKDHRSMFRALQNSVQKAKNSVEYQSILGPKVLSAIEERISLAAFLVQMAKGRVQAAEPGHERLKAEFDLQDASLFLKSQEAYRNKLQDVTRHFEQVQRRLVEAIEARLQNAFNLRDDFFQTEYREFKSFLTGTRANLNKRNREVQDERKRDVSVANLERAMWIAINPCKHPSKKAESRHRMSISRRS